MVDPYPADSPNRRQGLDARCVVGSVERWDRDRSIGLPASSAAAIDHADGRCGRDYGGGDSRWRKS